MSVLQRQVGRARRRLWLNRWVNYLGWCLLAAAGLYISVTVTRRVLGAEVTAADGWIALALAAAACLAAGVWSAIRRESAIVAATLLDETAGLKERISSGLYCAGSEDLFAKAVHDDAQRVAGALTVTRHLRVRYAHSITYAGGMIIVAALVLWLVKPLETRAARQRLADQQNEERLQATKAVIKKRIAPQVQKLAEDNPDLKDLKEFEALADLSAAKADLPGDLIRDQMKKVDALRDTVKQKRNAGDIEAMQEFKKMLRKLKTPASPYQAIDKLSRSLAQGDFKAAQQALKQLQEQLAKAGDQQDKQKLKALESQLRELGDKLAKTAEREKKLVDQMKKTGLTQEQAKRMLQNLAKKDLSQIKKDLEKLGLKEDQAQQLAKQMQKHRSACKLASKLGSAMSNAASAMGDMQMGQAMEGLETAGDQLSDLEMLEEEMKQLDSTLAQLSQLKDSLGKQCGQCQGTGMVGDGPCPGCQGSGMGRGQGGGMGKMGRGQGGIARGQETNVDFKKEREKVKTQRGRIIGQILVDGKQVPGQSNAAYKEAITAAEREASDAVAEERIPRKFQKAVKRYHTTLTTDAGAGKAEKP